MKKRQSPKIYPQKWAQIVLLIGFCFILFFLNLGRWDLWNPDEPRYAQVAREMVQGGDWILMHFNGKMYGDKPPLFFSAIAFSSFLWGGFDSFSARFPSAFFGTLTVVLTFLLGRSLYSSRTGFLAGLILATSVEFVYLSTRANIDVTLTFFTTAAFFCFYMWDQKKIQSRLVIYGFYVAMALATLTKGPVGFVLPLLGTLIYLLVQKDWEGLKRMRLLTGLLLMVAIILSWYLPAVLKGGQEYLDVTLFKHTLDRFSKGWSHVKPFYYYFYNFPVEFLPWFIFLPGAIVYGYSSKMRDRRKEFFFLLTWFAVIFLFFSISKGKRGLYVLPLYPAASLMIGKLWDDFISSQVDPFRREWIYVPLYLLAALFFLGGVIGPWFVSTRFPSYLSYSLPIALLLVAGSISIFVLIRGKNHGATLFLIFGIIAAGFLYVSGVVFPLVNPYKSARFISEEITARIRPGERLGLYGGFGTGPYNFYTGIVPIREMEKKEDLWEFLSSPEKVLCLLKFRDFSSFQSMEGTPSFRLITRSKIGGDDIVLITNR